MFYIGDCETDNLLDNVTKFHCIGFSPRNNNKFYIFCDLEELSNFDQEQFRTEFVDPVFFPTDDYLKLLDSPKTKGICFHNILGYDLPVFKKLSGIEYDWKSINGRELIIEDSLVLSQYLWPDRPIPKGFKGAHGLAAWGSRVGIGKPEVEDWSEQPLNVYINRMIEDIRINKAAYEILMKEKADVAIPNGSKRGQWELPLKMAHKTRYLMQQQEETGVKFNIEGAKKLVERIDKEMKEIEGEVEPILGMRQLPESQQPNFPKNVFKKAFDYEKPYTTKGGLKKSVIDYLTKINIPEEEMEDYINRLCEKENIDGIDICRNNIEENIKKHPDLLTQSAINYCEKFGITDPQEQLQEIHRVLRGGQERKLTEKLKLSHKKDVKIFLVQEMGWIPSMYKPRNILIDPKTKKKLSEEQTNKKLDAYIKEFYNSYLWLFILEELGYKKTSKIDPETDSFRKRCLRNGRNLISSPQYTDQRGELCKNLAKIDKDTAKKICRWLSLQNRRNTILSENGTGWLMHPRLNVDGRLPAGASGITNTTRQKHSVVVNVAKPKDHVVLGKEMRGLFIPEKDYLFIGCDSSGLESRVTAHYTWPFDNGAYADLVLEGDFHTTMAEAYSKAVGFEINRDDGKNATYACLPVDNTTVLTKNGWRKYEDLYEGQEILTYNTKRDRTEFQPIQKLHFFKNEKIINKYSSQWGFESTKNHRWYGFIRRQKGHRGERYFSNEFFTTGDINKEYNILNSAKYVGGQSEITPDEASIIAWILSDGYLKWNRESSGPSTSHGKKRGVLAMICQSRNKYYKEIYNLLDRNRIKYRDRIDERKNHNPVYRWYINPQYIRDLWDRAGIPWGVEKINYDWSQFVLGLSEEANDSFIHTWFLAEGYLQKKSRLITQNRNNLSECVLLSATLAGYNCSISQKKGCKNECIDIRLKERRHTTGQKLNESMRVGDVFCVTTENSTFIARQGDRITITGNCTYGVQSKKLSKMLSVSEDVAQKVIDAFWETNYGLSKSKDALIQYWESTGKKYIQTIDSSKIWVRSPHSCQNALFQSTGSKIMDWACCWSHDKIKREGLDFKRVLYVHDEVEGEQHESEVEVIWFEATPEDKLPLKDGKPNRKDDPLKPRQFRNGRQYSVPKFVDNRWVQCYSRAGELIAKGIENAGKYFKMNVPFPAEYMVSKLGWSGTH